MTTVVRPGAVHRLSVRVNNELDWSCLPPGEIVTKSGPAYPPGFKQQDYHFDFFNYAGIHRPVYLQSLPRQRVASIIIDTDIENSTGIVRYVVATTAPGLSVAVELLDPDASVVARVTGENGELRVAKARLWSPESPALHVLVVSVHDATGALVDRYRQRLGIRTVRIDGDRFLLNGAPYYLRGLCKHEDSEIHGRGLDLPVAVRDFHLMRWIGANSTRTSHYPYAEEFLDLADEFGIMVIDEVPAVGMTIWSDMKRELFDDLTLVGPRLEHHRDVMRDLIARDRNHPSVIMWSVGNEAVTSQPASRPYFKAVIDDCRSADPSRPIMLVSTMKPEECLVSDLVDVIGLNRYPSWYSDPGRLETVEAWIHDELTRWHTRFGKPVMMTEYGADCVAGLHLLPSAVFSEEYQVEMLAAVHRAVDRLTFVIGEHVWNFADFRTKQGITRVDGNKKGVFTRVRQPKAAAYSLRARWRKT